MWNKWNFLWNRIRKMDVHAMRDAVSAVHQRSGKARLFILLDMVWCALRYGAGYMDYLLFEMEALSGRQRATYLTRGGSSRLVASLNSPQHRVYFADKRKFNALFSGMLGREYLDLETAGFPEFLHFLRGKSCFIAKPPSGTGGLGVEKIEVGSADPVALYDALQASRHILLEECIVQHPALARLHPESVNTCRIVTLLQEGSVEVVTAFLRIGNGGAVDNFHSHGLVTKLEHLTGTALYDPVDRDGRVFPLHPRTGVKIKGFQVPYWEQALELVRRCAPVVPQIRYVGWDVAITPDGPVLIEGNEFPGHDLYQLPALTPEKIGILPQFEKILTT